MNKWITCAAVAALFLSFNIAHAVSCNPKAQVHQQRLANIQTAVSFGQIPSADDEQFVLCMLPEKEDQQTFKQRVQQIRNQQQARQQQEAEQRRQAIVAHNRPQSPEEQARAQAHCAGLVRESGELRNAGVAYCLAAWKANPHSMCGGGNLPCGSEIHASCYAPYAGQRCVSGRVIGGGAFNVSPWFQNAPVQITKLADGVYTDVEKPCANPGQPGVILIQGTNVRFGRNTYRLVNTKEQGVLDAMNNGGGDNGYDGKIIVSGSTFRWDGFGVDAPRPFRLCQAVGAASPVQQNDVPFGATTLPVGNLSDTEDSVQIISISPAAGSALRRGAPITFNIRVAYSLQSTDAAILSMSVLQLRESPLQCAAKEGELTDGVEVPIERGKRSVDIALTWSGDTGRATGGRVAMKGYLRFIPMFWRSNGGARGDRIRGFQGYERLCMSFD